ncbi:hypothetical protein [Dyella sp. Tek66A03]|uniref:hypothetical protein n=1 Tax=Dyella sp. Tek66A03 TaxID=3458298 RepID=UPI00403E8036
MELEFVTSLDERYSLGDSYGELFREAFREKIRALEGRISQRAIESLNNYGSRYSRQDYSCYRMLNPAGAWSGYWVSQEGNSPQIVMWARQLEVARHGFPDLYESHLAVSVEGNSDWTTVSKSIPTHTIDEAHDFFTAVLKGHHGDLLAHALGESPAIRLFGVASAPKALGNMVDVPTPNRTELLRATADIKKGAIALRDALRSWEGTDALNYLIDAGLRRDLRNFHSRGSSYPLEGTVEVLCSIEQLFSSPAKLQGRPAKGGREHRLAKILARLWTACGLGPPKLSPQSRFVRACAVVLPWHNVHKADVSQFMRAELKKETHKGVLIG